MTKYNVGIIGCGRIAWLMDEDVLRKKIITHAAAYLRCPKTQIIAACDVDQEKLHKFAERYPVKNLYSDFRCMLKNERIDIISICTLSDTHYEIVKEIVKLKYPPLAIFCEKPIASTLEQAKKMIDLCATNNIILAINHVRRWDGHYKKIRDLIASGKIGKIQNAVFYYSAGLANIGTHVFDTMGYLFGEVAEVEADYVSVNKKDKDPTVSAKIWFKSGFCCQLIGSDVNNYLMFELDIFGAKGRLRSLSNGEYLYYYSALPSRKYSKYKELDTIGVKVDFNDNQRMLDAIKDITDCIKNRKMPRCSGKDGFKALEITAAVYESLKTRKIVSLPVKVQKKNIHSK